MEGPVTPAIFAQAMIAALLAFALWTGKRLYSAVSDLSSNVAALRATIEGLDSRLARVERTLDRTE